MGAFDDVGCGCVARLGVRREGRRRCARNRVARNFAIKKNSGGIYTDSDSRRVTAPRGRSPR